MISRQSRNSGFIRKSVPFPLKKERRFKSSKEGYMKLSDEDVRMLVVLGFRVRSSTMHVLPN